MHLCMQHNTVNTDSTAHRCNARDQMASHIMDRTRQPPSLQAFCCIAKHCSHYWAIILAYKTSNFCSTFSKLQCHLWNYKWSHLSLICSVTYTCTLVSHKKVHPFIFVITQSNVDRFLPRCMECRCGLAMRILSVCPSVCLSVTRVNCDKMVERSVQIYIPYER